MAIDILQPIVLPKLDLYHSRAFSVVVVAASSLSASSYSVPLARATIQLSRLCSLSPCDALTHYA